MRLLQGGEGEGKAQLPLAKRILEHSLDFLDGGRLTGAALAEVSGTPLLLIISRKLVVFKDKLFASAQFRNEDTFARFSFDWGKLGRFNLEGADRRRRRAIQLDRSLLLARGGLLKSD